MDKMSVDKKEEETLAPTCLASVNRIVHLPVVESTVQVATTLYERMKEYNSLTHMACETAEGAVCRVVEAGRPIASPIVQGLEGPIKKVDGVLCTGLDYVEAKVPAMKLPPGEMYTTTKEYVNSTVAPAMESAYKTVEPAVKSALEKVEPAVHAAMTFMEPTYERAKTMVEPLVQPALEKVQQFGGHGAAAGGGGRQNAEEDVDCKDCHNGKNPENSH